MHFRYVPEHFYATLPALSPIVHGGFPLSRRCTKRLLFLNAVTFRSRCRAIFSIGSKKRERIFKFSEISKKKKEGAASLQDLARRYNDSRHKNRSGRFSPSRPTRVASFRLTSRFFPSGRRGGGGQSARLHWRNEDEERAVPAASERASGREGEGSSSFSLPLSPWRAEQISFEGHDFSFQGLRCVASSPPRTLSAFTRVLVVGASANESRAPIRRFRLRRHAIALRPRCRSRGSVISALSNSRWRRQRDAAIGV